MMLHRILTNHPILTSYAVAVAVLSVLAAVLQDLLR